MASTSASRPSGTKMGLAMNTERKPATCAPLRSVSTPSPMHRMCSLATGRPRDARDLGQRALVYGSVRLACVGHLAASGLVVGGERARAIDELVAALDHDIGIGADHRHAARDEAGEQPGVVGGRFPGVVVQARADHDLGHIGRRQAHVEAVEQALVALGADVQQRFALPCPDHVAGCVPGRDAAVVSSRIDAERGHVRHHGGERTRGVGEQDDGAAGGPEPGACVHGGLVGACAVVHHAPDVDDPGLAGRGEACNRGQNGDGREHRPSPSGPRRRDQAAAVPGSATTSALTSLGPPNSAPLPSSTPKPRMRANSQSSSMRPTMRVRPNSAR